MLKIACWGYYGKENLGDDLILSALLHHLDEGTEPAQITLFADQPISPPLPVTVCPRSVAALLKQSCKTDVLICGGGGLFAQQNTAKLLLWILLACTMKIRGKSLAFLGIGIGHQNFESALDRLLWRLLLSLAAGTVVRQHGVAKSLRMQANPKLVEAADMAFDRDTMQKPTTASPSNMIVFALAHVFGTTDSAECQRFCQGMGKAIDGLMEQGFRVHLVAFTAGMDECLYAAMTPYVTQADRLVYHPYTKDADKVLELFQQARYTVCMRYHSLVMSIVTHTPCCIVSYSDKLDDLIERLSLHHYALRVSPIPGAYYNDVISFDEERFSSALHRMMENEAALREQFCMHAALLQTEAQQNWQMLKTILERSYTKGREEGEA